MGRLIPWGIPRTIIEPAARIFSCLFSVIDQPTRFVCEQGFTWNKTESTQNLLVIFLFLLLQIFGWDHLPVHIPLVKFILFFPTLHLENFNVHLIIVLGENGNAADSGPKLTKNEGNQEIMRIGSPNSDIVQGIAPVTEIVQYQSKVKCSQMNLFWLWTILK